MTNIKFNIEERNEFTILKFELDGPIGPEILRELKAPEVTPRKGVVISGRGPIWLYAALVHEYHATRWVACFDPRLGGIVVQSHDPSRQVGDVIEV